MKVKDIVTKATFVVLTSKEGKIICDSAGCIGDYEKYKNATVESLYPFHITDGLYKEGVICKIKDNKDG